MTDERGKEQRPVSSEASPHDDEITFPFTIAPEASPNAAAEELRFIVSYLADHDQDANHAWMVRRIRAVLDGKPASTALPWQESDGVRRRSEAPSPVTTAPTCWLHPDCAALRCVRCEAQGMHVQPDREVEAAFIAAYAHFLRQSWVGLSDHEADEQRDACVSRFALVKYKLDDARRRESARPVPYPSDPEASVHVDTGVARPAASTRVEAYPRTTCGHGELLTVTCIQGACNRIVQQERAAGPKASLAHAGYCPSANGEDDSWCTCDGTDAALSVSKTEEGT